MLSDKEGGSVDNKESAIVVGKDYRQLLSSTVICPVTTASQGCCRWNIYFCNIVYSLFLFSFFSGRGDGLKIDHLCVLVFELQVSMFIRRGREVWGALRELNVPF